MIECVTDIKHPVKKGEIYLVPCVAFESERRLHVDFSRIHEKRSKTTYITPVIDHPHNDMENGQTEVHYHADYRFIKHENDKNFPTIINKHSKHFWAEAVRIGVGHTLGQHRFSGELSYYVLPVINEDFTGITPTKLITNSNLKHRCIHKGKCPHRGYDLSQVAPRNGEITCPLHGLVFDAETKRLKL